MILRSLAQKKYAVSFTLPGKCCLPKMCQLSIVLSVIVWNRQKSFPPPKNEVGVIFRNSQALYFHEPFYFLINKWLIAKLLFHNPSVLISPVGFLLFLIIHVFTGVSLLISFKNFSPAFTTRQMFRRPSFQPISTFHVPSSQSSIITSFDWKRETYDSLFTRTPRGHCRVINWPHWDPVVSQGIGKPRETERHRQWPVSGALRTHPRNDLVHGLRKA